VLVGEVVGPVLGNPLGDEVGVGVVGVAVAAGAGAGGQGPVLTAPGALLMSPTFPPLAASAFCQARSTKEYPQPAA
jgi:hypothetical protein